MSIFNQTKWLVTGAGSGIGRLMAKSLARQGAIVALMDRDAEPIQKLEREIRAEGGIAKAFVADVRDFASLQAAKTQIEKEVGLIDGLVNNAGIVHGGEFEKVSMDIHRNIYETNTIGLVAVTHLFLNDLFKAKLGRLVLIASVAGKAAFPFGATYGSSKWAVVGLAESLRVEFKERKIKNVRITTICPAYINTGMFEGITPPFLFPILDPEKLAGKIMRAIENESAYLHEPFLAKTTDLMRALLPIFLQDCVYQFFRLSTAMKTWKGRSSKSL
jgi:all-trans-retinol dehydrogenase (NAD+)